MDNPGRLLRLKKKLRAFDAVLVTSRENIRYLTGFTGSSGFVFISRDFSTLVTDFRYREQSADEVRGCDVLIEGRSFHSAVKAICRRHGAKRIGFEGSLGYSQYSSLASSSIEPVPMGDMLERMREQKDDGEVGFIVNAVERAERAFLDIKPRIRAGVREREIALRLEQRVRELGSGGVPFDIIVASGPNSSRPHASATERKLAPGDLLTIDWGAEAGGYFSDMTRTFLVSGGRGTAEKKRIYSLVLEANRRALRKLRAGVRLKDVDSAARGHIAKAGYGEHFGHGLGHGVGLEVHERPRLSPKSRASARPGMVVTVEPGIYVPGLGGVRIEDMALVEVSRARVLTKLPVQLEIIGSGR
jgi:Xaa-Pro aminopeptidase